MLLYCKTTVSITPSRTPFRYWYKFCDDVKFVLNTISVPLGFTAISSTLFTVARVVVVEAPFERNNTRLLEKSAMYKLLEPSKASPLGEFKVVDVFPEDPVPKTLVTTPNSSTFRIL